MYMWENVQAIWKNQWNSFPEPFSGQNKVQSFLVNTVSSVKTKNCCYLCISSEKAENLAEIAQFCLPFYWDKVNSCSEIIVGKIYKKKWRQILEEEAKNWIKLLQSTD